MHDPLNVKSEILLQSFRSDSTMLKVGFWVRKMALLLILIRSNEMQQYEGVYLR